MSDVTAVVFSIGEKTTQRAIESLEKQSYKLKDIILIENVTPSYKAGNLGASKVNTEFLVIVGADFILDSDCIGSLRSCIKEGVGIVTGHLRDALIGRTVGVRMYRRLCFDIAKNKDSVSPDTDFRNAVNEKGWKTIYALKYYSDRNKYLWHTFGSHKPVYSRLYTFSKFRIEGRRYRYWKNLKGMIWKFSRLRESIHPMKFVAQIAMGHGFFMQHDNDMLEQYIEDEEYILLKDFMSSEKVLKVNNYYTYNSELTNYEIFNYHYNFGNRLRKSCSYLNLKKILGELVKSEDVKSLIARLGLCQGIFVEEYSSVNVENDYCKIESIL